jgi:hypothetical protein
MSRAEIAYVVHDKWMDLNMAVIGIVGKLIRNENEINKNRIPPSSPLYRLCPLAGVPCEPLMGGLCISCKKKMCKLLPCVSNA